MKVIKLAEPWKISCVDIEKPVPKPGEALIKVVAAGICGSDIGAFRGPASSATNWLALWNPSRRTTRTASKSATVL